MSDETIRCPFCLDGEWYRNNDFKEPYGYPYRPRSIPCAVCHGSKAILKEFENMHPELRKVTEVEREEFSKKLQVTPIKDDEGNIISFTASGGTNIKKLLDSVILKSENV